MKFIPIIENYQIISFQCVSHERCNSRKSKPRDHLQTFVFELIQRAWGAREKKMEHFLISITKIAESSLCSTAKIAH